MMLQEHWSHHGPAARFALRMMEFIGITTMREIEARCIPYTFGEEVCLSLVSHGFRHWLSIRSVLLPQELTLWTSFLVAAGHVAG